MVVQSECSSAASYGAIHHNTAQNYKVCLQTGSITSHNAAAHLAVEKPTPKTKELLDFPPVFLMFDFSQLEPSKASVILSERKWQRSSSLWSIIPGRRNSQLREILSVPNGLCQRCSTFPFSSFQMEKNHWHSVPCTTLKCSRWNAVGCTCHNSACPSVWGQRWIFCVCVCNVGKDICSLFICKLTRRRSQATKALVCT